MTMVMEQGAIRVERQSGDSMIEVPVPGDENFLMYAPGTRDRPTWTLTSPAHSLVIQAWNPWLLLLSGMDPNPEPA